MRPIHWCAGSVLAVVCSKACAGCFQMLETSEHKQGVLAHAAQGATCVSPSASIAPCCAACAQCLDMNHTSPPSRAFRTTCRATLKSPGRVNRLWAYLMRDTRKGLHGFEKILNSAFLLQVQPVAGVPDSAPRTGTAFPLKQGHFLFRYQMIHRTLQVQPAAGVPETHGRLGPLPDGAVGQRAQPRLRHPQRLSVHAAVGRLEIAASACLSCLSSLHQT